jgi:hypothetical protein
MDTDQKNRRKKILPALLLSGVLTGLLAFPAFAGDSISGDFQKSSGNTYYTHPSNGYRYFFDATNSGLYVPYDSSMTGATKKQAMMNGFFTAYQKTIGTRMTKSAFKYDGKCGAEKSLLSYVFRTIRRLLSARYGFDSRRKRCNS